MTLFLVYMVTLAEFCFAHNYLEAGWYSTWAKLLACVVQEVRAAYYFFYTLPKETGKDIFVDFNRFL